MLNENYKLTNILRTGLSPLSAMIGLSIYYGRHLTNPILGTLNALLFGKKLTIDIWHLNQMPSTKSRLLNSSKKILLGLGTIGLVSYSKFTSTIITPIEPTSTTLSPISTTTIPWVTLMPELSTTTQSTTTVDPWPPLRSNLLTNVLDNNIIDLETFISLNIYGITNIITGITELIPNKFNNIKKVINILSGASLISSGISMGINNNVDNGFTIPTIIAGVSEIINNLLPVKTIHTNNIELQQNTEFNNETARLVNACDTTSNYTLGSMDTMSVDSDVVLWDRINRFPNSLHL